MFRYPGINSPVVMGPGPATGFNGVGDLGAIMPYANSSLMYSPLNAFLRSTSPEAIEAAKAQAQQEQLNNLITLLVIGVAIYALSKWAK